MVLIKFRVTRRQASRPLAAKAKLSFCEPKRRPKSAFQSRYGDGVSSAWFALRRIGDNNLAKIERGRAVMPSDDIIASRCGSLLPEELISRPTISEPSASSKQSAAVITAIAATKQVAFEWTELTSTPLVRPSMPSATAGLDAKNTKPGIVRSSRASSRLIGNVSSFSSGCGYGPNSGGGISRLSPLLTNATLLGRYEKAPSNYSAGAASTWRPLHTSICALARPADRRASQNLLLGSHVREALSNGEPIVALESTVITHGLPEPENFDLALELEDIVATSGGAGNDNSNVNHPSLLEIEPPPHCVGGNGDKARDNKIPTSLPGSIVIEPAKPAPIVTPSTIGIVKGQIIIGLSRQELAYLASKRQSRPIKASRRDVPVAMASGLSAGTTVAATLAIACSLPGAPIKVFATGGTGGVHLGGERSMDVSADLYELARSPMGVVSSGFKWFLDTRRSLELLETLGCTVMSLAPIERRIASLSTTGKGEGGGGGGGSSELLFPGFFAATNQQKVKSPLMVHSVEEAAKILFHCLEANPFDEQRGSLIAVPIPSQFEISNGELDILLKGVEEIDGRLDVEGKEKTPLILERLSEATGGKTLRANLELLKNNAKVGAQLALKYAKLANRTGAILLGEQDSFGRMILDNFEQVDAGTIDGKVADRRLPASDSPMGAQRAQGVSVGEDRLGLEAENARGDGKQPALAARSPVVVGCTMIDMHVSTNIDARFKSNRVHSGVTFQGWPHLTVGGVGQNLAFGLQLLGHEPTFVTALARDELAKFAQSQLSQIGLDRKLQVSWWECKNGEQKRSETASEASSTCFALVLIDSISGQCQYVIANLEAIKAISSETIAAHSELIINAPLLVMDANLIGGTMQSLIELCRKHRVPVFIEPTDVSVLPRLVDCLGKIQLHDAQPKDPNAGLPGDAGPAIYEQPFSPLLCLSPNAIELEGMVSLFEGLQLDISIKDKTNTNQSEPHSLAEIELMAKKLMQIHLPSLKCLLVTMDKRGVLVAVRSRANSIEKVRLMEELSADLDCPILIRHFAPKQLVNKPISASGAGDSFASGFLSGLLRGLSLEGCLELGFEAASLALQDRDTVPKSLRRLAVLDQPSNLS